MTGFRKDQNHRQFSEFRRLDRIAPEDIQPRLHALGPVENGRNREQEKGEPVKQFRALTQDFIRKSHDDADDQRSDEQEKALLGCVGGIKDMIEEGGIHIAAGRKSRHADGHDAKKRHTKNKRDQYAVDMGPGAPVLFSDVQAG